jgi:hypothetical protein
MRSSSHYLGFLSSISAFGDEVSYEMNKLIAFFLGFLFPISAFAGEFGYKVVYDGGSLPESTPGTYMKLFLEGNNIRIMRDQSDVIVVPVAAITEISYGQDVHRRVGAAEVSFRIGALLALSKPKEQFVGITWDKVGQKGGIALRADKSDYRDLLAGLEVVTGKNAVDSGRAAVKNQQSGILFRA